MHSTTTYNHQSSSKYSNIGISAIRTVEASTSPYTETRLFEGDDPVFLILTTSYAARGPKKAPTRTASTNSGMVICLVRARNW